jgi:PAS domain S-box-containing protein
VPVLMKSTIATVVGALDRAAAALCRVLHRYASNLGGHADAVANQSPFYGSEVESLIHAFFGVDLNCNITAWNRGAERLFGFAAADVIGRHISIIIPNDRRHEIASILDRVYRDEPVEDFETVRVGRDGRLIDVVLSVSPMKTPAGAIVGSLALAHNVTDKKQAEEQFRLAVEACPAGMIMTNEAGQITMVNGEVERLFGYRREELIGRSIEILVPPSMRDNHVRARRDYNSHPDPRRLAVRRNLRAVRKDGVEFPAEVLLNPMHTRNGLMVLSVVIDNSEAKRQDQMKDEFVATVSHELRTPMTSIAGSLGLLIGNAGGQLPEPMARLLTIAHRNSQRLVRLINDVLDIEKIESGKMQFDMKRVEARAVVEQALESARGFAEGYGVRIRLDPNSQRADVRADPDRLIQVITNLLSNAAKFSPRDADVEVNVQTLDRRVRMAVRDHGPGVAPEFRARIFEKFAQAHSSDSHLKGGTGLGLSIAKQIVVRLGGEIGFTDAPGGGTIFFVDLPKLDAAAYAEDEASSQRDAIEASDLAHPRLLVCGHDRQSTAAIAQRLDASEFSSDIAATLDEAVERAASAPYSGILLDGAFPDCDPVTLILEFRALPQSHDTPIIIMSGDLDPGREELRTLGLDVLDWLRGPVNIHRLAHSLGRFSTSRAPTRPRVLHIDADSAILRALARALDRSADVVSVQSVDAARAALADHFDLAVLGTALISDSGLELLSELCTGPTTKIPVIVLSRHAVSPNARPATERLSDARVPIDPSVTAIPERRHTKNFQNRAH